MYVITDSSCTSKVILRDHIKHDKVNLLLNEEVDLLPVEEAVVDLAFPHPVQPVQHHTRVEAL